MSRLDWRRYALFAGLAIVLLDLLADPLQGHPLVFGGGQLLLLAVVVLAMAALRFGKAVVLSFAAISMLVVSIALLLVVVEVGSAFAVKHLRPSDEAVGDELADIQAQIEADQNPFEDSLEYRPFVVWRQRPLATPTTNVDSAGLRRTIGTRCSAGSFRVFMFGGSTMWGYQTDDAGTIPTHLQAILARSTARPVCVVNMGELAWVSSQGLVAFTRLLAEGTTPDAVIFYDGINDVYAPLEPEGQPGQHLALSRVRARMSRGIGGQLRRLVVGSHFVELVAEWRRRREAVRGPTPAQLRELDSLVTPVLSIYAGNMRIAGQLANARQIPHLFFWQPALLAGAKPMSPSEAAMCRNARVAERHLFGAAYSRSAPVFAAVPMLHDISQVFAADTTRLYVDDEHITGAANERIARVMASFIVRDSAWLAQLPGLNALAAEIPEYTPPIPSGSLASRGCTS